MVDFSLEPEQGDPFGLPMQQQPLPQPGEMPHTIMPEQERELGGGGAYEPIPMLGGGGRPAAAWRAEPEAPPPMGHNMPPPGPLPDVAPGEEYRISTTLPVSKPAIERLGFDPHQASTLNIGQDAARASGAAYEKNANIIRNDYTGHAIDPELDAHATSEAFIEHLRSNLVALHNAIPEAERLASKEWYDGANGITEQWGNEFNLHPSQVAGVIAAQSPQKDWDQNLDLARRTMSIYRNQQDTPITPDMLNWARGYMDHPDTSAKSADAMLDFLNRNSDGRPLSQMQGADDIAHFIRIYDQAHNLNRGYPTWAPNGTPIGPALNEDGSEAKVGWGSMPTIAKAVSIMQDGSVPNISGNLGGFHKVRSFYNNMISPNARQGDTTIDTHAIAAANLFPLTGEDDMVQQGLGQKGSGSDITGSRGLYGLYHEAYRRAAGDLGYQLPRQVQSVVWTGVRNLFPAEYKAQPWFREPLQRIWQAFQDGRSTLAQAQASIIATARRLVSDARSGGAPAAPEE